MIKDWLTEQYLYYRKLDFQDLRIRIGLFELNYFIDLWNCDMWRVHLPKKPWRITKMSGPQPNPEFAHTSTGIDIYREISGGKRRYWFRYFDRYHWRTRQLSIAIDERTGLIQVRYGLDEYFGNDCRDVIVCMVLSSRGSLLDFYVYVEDVLLLNKERYFSYYTSEINDSRRLEDLQLNMFNIVQDFTREVDNVLGEVDRGMESQGIRSNALRYGLLLFTALSWTVCVFSAFNGPAMLTLLFGVIGAFGTLISMVYEFMNHVDSLERIKADQ